MAKQGTKTEMLRCNVTADAVCFEHVKRVGEDWEVVEQLEVVCASVPDRLEDGDGFASMKAYGIRAFMSDRTSQLREYGIAKTLEGMAEVAAMLQNGVYRTKRKTGGAQSNDLLIQAVADLKGLSFEVAKATIAKLDKDRLEVLKANPQVKEKIAELRAAVVEAETVDLDDLMGDL